ncbi:nucleotidyl transferase AbiEii/AbiGii toxin family protein [Lentisphaerota bacterium ZTH]|nr:nucleotidyl transferase AbiEii/AbiGii toxin family protein [Lentisphaerota bacterium]WET06186.1 nucleotidyl transferase AbiEii/AbiGii toxin family protein [Lentisphaerota bacterium ZTH]
MDSIAKLNESDRKDLISETASRQGINSAVIEKDFWVCWILRHLFLDDEIKSKVVFKGGTTLSKIFNVIKRFSEDIDLILDWDLLDCGSNPNQLSQLSRNKRDKFTKEINEKASDYIKNNFHPLLSDKLTKYCSDIIIEINNDDPQCIDVVYPTSFSDDYIKPHITLEIGPLGAWHPNQEYLIRPYIAEEFPNLFKDPDCRVKAIKAERTFWEKATILHQEAHRDDGFKERYSRHYYDLSQLAKSTIKENALRELNYLDDVRKFKIDYYSCKWANYQNAIPGSFRLIPAQKTINELRRDYKSMKESMIFNQAPSFDSVIQILQDLEEEINSL